MDSAFDLASISSSGDALIGDWRRPRQLLAGQRLPHGQSIHEDATAAAQGYRRGLIEGTTHLSQFAPLLYRAWGATWFERGSISARYKSPVYDGDEVRASLELDKNRSKADIVLSNREGVTLVEGIASCGSLESSRRQNVGETAGAVDESGGPKVGMFSRRAAVNLTFEGHLGEMYPFTLQEKLKVITEPSPWYVEKSGENSPWYRPIIPLEMIGVLLRHKSENFPFPVDYPYVQLFGDQEIHIFNGPLFVNETYVIQHRVIAYKETRRFSTCRIWTDVFNRGSDFTVASMALTMIGLSQNPGPVR